MTAKPQLVLDLAGVLISNFPSSFWLEISENSNITLQEIREQFDEVRKDLWTGKIKEEHFWEWLRKKNNLLNKEKYRKLLIESLVPLPAVNCLAEWSHIADIHILSNHCLEWVEPILMRIKPFTKSITISNQVGLRKPDIQIYKHVENQFDYSGPNRNILYIDDQAKNLLPATRLGWGTLLADKEHRWIEEVKPIILQNSIVWRQL